MRLAKTQNITRVEYNRIGVQAKDPNILVQHGHRISIVQCGNSPILLPFFGTTYDGRWGKVARYITRLFTFRVGYVK
jgi:hypothetical protein